MLFFFHSLITYPKTRPLHCEPCLDKQEYTFGSQSSDIQYTYIPLQKENLVLQPRRYTPWSVHVHAILKT